MITMYNGLGANYQVYSQNAVADLSHGSGGHSRPTPHNSNHPELNGIPIQLAGSYQIFNKVTLPLAFEDKTPNFELYKYDFEVERRVLANSDLQVEPMSH